MTYFTRSATRHFLLILILPVFYFPLFSQDVQWAYSNGGHSTDQVGGMELAGDEVIYSTSTGLLKMNASGGIIWRFDFFDLDDYQYSSRPALGEITADEEGNIYAQLSFPSSEPGFTTIDNIDIPHGSSLVKINANGELLWCRKLTNTQQTRLAYHSGNVYAIGLFDSEINLAETYFFDNVENTECSSGGWQNEYAQDIFIARFNTIGQIQNAITIAGPGYDVPRAVTVDAKGNLYIASNYGMNSCIPDETRLHKFTPDLVQVWSETICREFIEGNGNWVLEPTNLYVGGNDKLYVWAYSRGTVISNNYRFEDTSTYGDVGGLLEYSTQDASFLRFRAFSGMSVFGKQGFMETYQGHLLVATTFRETKEFDNGTISTVSQGDEPILLKVDLNSFRVDHQLHIKGPPRDDFRSIKDWSGPIKVKGDVLYYSGNFSSDTLLLDAETMLINNSGNNAQDYFLVKYDFSTTEFNSEFQDDDLDGVSNVLDLCPDTPPGLATDSSGCALDQKDSDQDGITDDFDLCPESPPGSMVNEDGCTADQLDDDGDGIPDYRDECPDTASGTRVNEQGCEIITLGAQSFSVVARGENCPGVADGLIGIQASDPGMRFTAVLNGTESVDFMDNMQFNSLPPGLYELCISAAETDSDEICYSLNIEPATEISMDAEVYLLAGKLRLRLSGAQHFTVQHNGKSFDTTQSYLELDLKEGENVVTASSDKDCQGMASYILNVDSGMKAVPNPFTDHLQLFHNNKEAILVRLYHQNGQLVYKGQFAVNTEVLIDNLNGLPSGIYVLELESGNRRYFQKIMKQ